MVGVVVSVYICRWVCRWVCRWIRRISEWSLGGLGSNIDRNICGKGEAVGSNLSVKRFLHLHRLCYRVYSSLYSCHLFESHFLSVGFGILEPKNSASSSRNFQSKEISSAQLLRLLHHYDRSETGFARLHVILIIISTLRALFELENGEGTRDIPSAS